MISEEYLRRRKARLRREDLIIRFVLRVNDITNKILLAFDEKAFKEACDEARKDLRGSR